MDIQKTDLDAFCLIRSGNNQRFERQSSRVWSDYAPGNYEIFYKKSTDGGANWTMKRLTWSTGGSYSPELAFDSSDNLHVVWSDDSHGEMEIYFKRSTDGGVTWSIKRLTWNMGNSDHPRIATGSSDNIFVIWEDDTPGNTEIYLRKGTQ